VSLDEKGGKLTAEKQNPLRALRKSIKYCVEQRLGTLVNSIAGKKQLE